MLTEDLKILAENCGFFFCQDQSKGRVVEADNWESVHKFANLLVNTLIMKAADSNIDHGIVNFLNFKLSEEFRKYGIHINQRDD